MHFPVEIKTNCVCYLVDKNEKFKDISIEDIGETQTS